MASSAVSSVPLDPQEARPAAAAAIPPMPATWRKFLRDSSIVFPFPWNFHGEPPGACVIGRMPSSTLVHARHGALPLSVEGRLGFWRIRRIDAKADFSRKDIDAKY